LKGLKFLNPRAYKLRIMAVLLTGGTGKTSIRIARLLQDAKTPFLLASRRAGTTAPSEMLAVTFDWLDTCTFTNPFKQEFPNGTRISAVYLVMPEVADPATPMNAFIDYAFNEHGVKRFVLIGGSSTELGGPRVGEVWQHLVEIGAEYCVLRPTWFMGTCIPDMSYVTPTKGME
jgi:festuclavine dehydrogenase